MTTPSARRVWQDYRVGVRDWLISSAAALLGRPDWQPPEWAAMAMEAHREVLDDNERFRDALRRIAAVPCSNGDDDMSCPDFVADDADWCTYCLAWAVIGGYAPRPYEAPSPRADLPPRGGVAHPEPKRDGGLAGSGCVPNLP